MADWTRPLPDVAHVDDPGHVEDHNMIVDAVREIRGIVDQVGAGLERPAGSTEWISPEDPAADTHRIRITSSQKQEASNGFDGGEVAWFDLQSPLAKAMLTWRLRYDQATRAVYPAGAAPADAPYRRVVWAGAHWFAQDQPDESSPTVIHGHWSVETPRPNGQLHTRLQVFFNDRQDPTLVGSEVALISTNLADFMVQRNMGADGVTPAGRFIIAGSHSLDRGLDLHRGTDGQAGRRWFIGLNGQTESSGDAGGNFVVRRHADDGTLLSHAMKIVRKTGSITLGSDAEAPASAPAQVIVSGDGGPQNGLLVLPRSPLDPGAAGVRGRFTTLSQLLLASQIGSAQDRFTIDAGGRISWGGGAGAADVALYRDTAGRLKTDTAFAVGGGIRVAGATTEGGGDGLVAINNAVTVPTANNASGGLLYVETGALKYRGANGTITELGPA